MADIPKTCATCAYANHSPGFGLTICSKHEIPVSVRGYADQTTKLAKDIAATCPDYMPAAMPTVALKSSSDPRMLPVGVSISGMKTASATTALPVGRERPSVCSQCTYYATPSAVQAEFSFPVGMCVPNASLINPNEQGKCAGNCDFGVLGMPTMTPNYVQLDSRFSPRSSKKSKAMKSGAQGPRHHSSVDPRDWVSDRQVTDDEAKAGIRAWRKVSDPKRVGEDVFMPIVNWAELVTSTGEKLIPRDPRTTYGSSKPELYTDHAGLLYTMAKLMMGNVSPTKALTKTPALIGEAGTGKSELFLWMAWLMDLPFVRISCTPATEVYQLEGKDTLVAGPNGETLTKFQLGRLAEAISKPCVICLDEPNAAGDEVWFFTRPIFDGASQIVIESEKLVIDRDPFCFIGCAMNPDSNPVYRGTRPLSEADWNRLVPVHIGLPPEEVERDIIRLHCESDDIDLDERTLDKLMRIAGQIRPMAASGELDIAWGIRSQIKVAQLTDGFSLEDSFRLALTNRLDDTRAELILKIVRDYA